MLENNTEIKTDEVTNTPVVEPAIIPTEIKEETKSKNNFLNSGWWPLFSWLLFFVIFWLTFIYTKPIAKDIQNGQILKIFAGYSQYVGAIFGLLSMVIIYILFGIKKLILKTKLNFINAIILAAAYLPWYFFARYLILYEKRYTDIGRGVITYIAGPLKTATLCIFILSIVWLTIGLLLNFRKKK